MPPLSEMDPFQQPWHRHPISILFFATLHFHFPVGALAPYQNLSSLCVIYNKIKYMELIYLSRQLPNLLLGPLFSPALLLHLLLLEQVVGVDLADNDGGSGGGGFGLLLLQTVEGVGTELADLDGGGTDRLVLRLGLLQEGVNVSKKKNDLNS